MGCFDSVCSVSHIPISAGDDVVMLFVGTTFDNYGGIKYLPIMLPIFGKYNDYGDLEDVDENNIGWEISQLLMETDFKDVTLPTHRESTPWEVFKDEVHCSSSQILPDHWTFSGKSEFKLNDPPSYAPDRVTYEKVKGNGSIVGKMFIHRRVYDHMINSYLNVKIGWKKPVKFKTYLDDIPEFIKGMANLENIRAEIEAASGEKDIVEKILLEHNISLFSIHTRLVINDVDNKFDTTSYHPLVRMFESCGSDERCMYFYAMLRFKDILTTTCANGDLDKAEEFLRAIMEVFTFINGLKLHNMEPTPYLGFAWEQHESIPDARRMNKLFNVFKSIESNKIKEYKSWEEE